MSNIIKNNKTPITDKVVTKKENSLPSTYQDLYLNELVLDDELKKELDSKNLAFRFINATKLRQAGVNKSMWVPYKRESKPTTESISALFGTDVDGYVRRGDLILAVQSKELNQRRKALISRQNELYQNVNALKANEFKKNMREHNIKTTVVEGYDED